MCSVLFKTGNLGAFHCRVVTRKPLGAPKRGKARVGRHDGAATDTEILHGAGADEQASKDSWYYGIDMYFLFVFGRNFLGFDSELTSWENC